MLAANPCLPHADFCVAKSAGITGTVVVDRPRRSASTQSAAQGAEPGAWHKRSFERNACRQPPDGPTARIPSIRSQCSAAIRETPCGGKCMEPPSPDEVRRKSKRTEYLDEGNIADIEAARV
jgi:hypothetical protein